ncbi:hypothetical protein V5O48_019519, partial [Marasmius crinis-equi]
MASDHRDTANTSDTTGSMNASSSGASLGSAMQLLIAMPLPGATGSPSFSGTGARSFLDTIKRLSDNAGLDEDEAVNQIYAYCQVRIQDTIRYVRELSLSKTGKTWDKARKKFLQLYGASDEEPSVSLSDLQKFCTRSNGEPVFTSRSEIASYQQRFLKYSGPLEHRNIISEKD